MSGESQCDVATALFLGYLARGDADRARRVLEELPHDVCEEAHREYLWGVYWRNRGNFAEAETCLQRAVSETPGHDPARAQLASLLEGQGKFDLALRQYVELAAHCGGSDAAIQGMARTLRVLGRVDAARTVLSPLAAKPNPSASVVFDMGWIELESGNIEEAERRFAVMQFDDATLDKMYTPTRITLGLRGKVVEASRLCDKVAAYDDRRLRIVELSSRLSNNPLDAAARAEIERLQGQSSPFSTKDAFGAPVQNADPQRKPAPETAAELYSCHCSACHGATGDGLGPASRHLFPRSRDLRTGRCKLVSTLNGVPTREDLERVLLQGMPGTSMPSFKKLTETERGLLTQEVLRLRHEGVREQVLRHLRQAGEEADEAEVRLAVEVCTTPGERARLPRSWHDRDQGARGVNRSSRRWAAPNVTATTRRAPRTTTCSTNRVSRRGPATSSTSRSKAAASRNRLHSASLRGCRALRIPPPGIFPRSR